MELKDIEKLALLSRLAISDTEKEALLHDFAPILKYIGQIEGVTLDDSDTTYPVRNVMRPDTNPTVGGTYSADAIALMPASQDGYLKVKQIL